MANEKIRIEHILSSDRTGDGDQLVTADSGTKTTGNLASWDADDNAADSGVAASAVGKVSVAKAGSLVGTRGRINFIEGSNVTLTVTDDSGNDEVDVTVASTGGGGGSVVGIRDGLALLGDPAPASPNTEDDEFDSSTLDAKWTNDVDTSNANDIDTTWRSHLAVRFTGNQDYQIYQTYAPGGDFTLSAKFRHNPQASFMLCGVGVFDDDESDGVLLRWYNSGGAVRLVWDTKNGGSFSFDNVVVGLPYSNMLVVHMERSTNTWDGFGSFDGVSFFYLGSVSKTFTVDRIRIYLGAGGTSGVSRWWSGCDWIRRDWITI